MLCDRAVRCAVIVGSVAVAACPPGVGGDRLRCCRLGRVRPGSGQCGRAVVVRRHVVQLDVVELLVPGAEHLAGSFVVEVVLPLADDDGGDALPRTLMNTRPSLRIRSMPTMRASVASGMPPTAVSVLARTMNAPPAMPAVPLLVSIMTPTITSCCCQLRSMPTAWARNSVAMVR